MYGCSCDKLRCQRVQRSLMLLERWNRYQHKTLPSDSLWKEAYAKNLSDLGFKVRNGFWHATFICDGEVFAALLPLDHSQRRCVLAERKPGKYVTGRPEDPDFTVAYQDLGQSDFLERARELARNPNSNYTTVQIASFCCANIDLLQHGIEGWVSPPSGTRHDWKTFREEFVDENNVGYIICPGRIPSTATKEDVLGKPLDLEGKWMAPWESKAAEAPNGYADYIRQMVPEVNPELITRCFDGELRTEWMLGEIPESLVDTEISFDCSLYLVGRFLVQTESRLIRGIGSFLRCSRRIKRKLRKAEAMVTNHLIIRSVEFCLDLMRKSFKMLREVRRALTKPNALHNSAKAVYEIPGRLGGHSTMAIPDTGSSVNTMNKSFADAKGFSIVDRDDDGEGSEIVIKTLNNSNVVSRGTIELDWRFNGEPDAPHKLLFHIVENAPHNIILGAPFLGATHTLSSKSHRVRRRIVHASHYPRILNVCYQQDNQNGALLPYAGGTLDDRPASALADSASDANIMSLSYARAHSYSIEDDSPSARQLFRFADGSTQQSLGQVQALWTFPDGQKHTLTFDVLADSLFDLVLGQDLIFDTEMFKRHADSIVYPSSSPRSQLSPQPQLPSPPPPSSPMPRSGQGITISSTSTTDGSAAKVRSIFHHHLNPIRRVPFVFRHCKKKEEEERPTKSSARSAAGFPPSAQASSSSTTTTTTAAAATRTSPSPSPSSRAEMDRRLKREEELERQARALHVISLMAEGPEKEAAIRRLEWRRRRRSGTEGTEGTLVPEQTEMEEEEEDATKDSASGG